MTTKTHILPCPFDCGADENYKPYLVKDDHWNSFYVMCSYCEAQGVSEKNEEDALNNWNNRRSLTKNEDYLRGYYDCKKQFMELIQDKLTKEVER
jgi:Lar family restriction alleviation protein